MILLGILAKELGLEEDILRNLIRQYFKPALQEVNLKAVEEGFSRAEVQTV